MTKIQAMKALEAKGLSFTANVIMNGCGKPTSKMKTILFLLSTGHDVRHAPQETLGLVINGKFVWIGQLDKIAEQIALDKVLNNAWASKDYSGV